MMDIYVHTCTTLRLYIQIFHFILYLASFIFFYIFHDRSLSLYGHINCSMLKYHKKKTKYVIMIIPFGCFRNKYERDWSLINNSFSNKKNEILLKLVVVIIFFATFYYITSFFVLQLNFIE